MFIKVQRDACGLKHNPVGGSQLVQTQSYPTSGPTWRPGNVFSLAEVGKLCLENNADPGRLENLGMMA